MSADSKPESGLSMNTPEIDIVIPWVDGGDPEWRAERAQYTASSSSDNSEARYRDWDLLRYWFRAIEKNAPWVRTIHFVTWGHLPQWLDTSNPKLHIVNHRDYIPGEYLPTFSSHTLELNMHRIEGLSEQFLYFNDDVYLMGSTCPEDFFLNGLARDSAVLGLVKNTDVSNFMPYIMLNMLAVINMRFSQRSVLKKHFRKWFRPEYGPGLLMNLYLAPQRYFVGIRNWHTCTPFTRTTLRQVWEEVPEILDATCRRRFRSREDVNQYLFRYWRLAKGEFVPQKPNSTYLTIGSQSTEDVKRVIDSGKYKVVCINDDPMGFDFEQEQEKLAAMFRELFPERSSFERE